MPVRISLALIAIVLLVGVLDRQSLPPLEAAVQDATRRKEVAPEVLADIAYWRRHEENRAKCRGQRYVYSCCNDSWDAGDLTCVSMEQKNIR